MRQYYLNTSKSIIKRFEDLYEAVLRKEGEPSPAWLYNLDKYWKLLAQTKEELQKLGDNESSLLFDNFTKEYENVYKALALPSQASFSSISTQAGAAIIAQPWTQDGVHFSQRVWRNTKALAETLNDELVNCLLSGKSSSDLKKILMERFSVSYNRASTLVRTESAHFQNAAAINRYKDAGVKYVKVLVSPDERTCDECSAHEGELIPIDAAIQGINIPPFHANCRDTIEPVFEG